jgi:Asp-tRNA(Asn)/Glu-tRNA(Gln) amidotransferase A subunit family amidase
LSEELTRLSATELAALIRRRGVSPVEVVEAHLRRVERLNPRLNAVVTLAPDALERAREAEAFVSRGARGAEASDAARGKPLLGVPVTVKDTIAVAGLPATSGSKARAGYVPKADAPAVALLKEAGAIVVGKTNTSELALDYTTDNPVFGHTNNPHDLARTSGGSSGGCAAAVAACLTAASLGSDLAGSIRIPAHFCGVAGLKPTAGRVNGLGHFPLMSAPYDNGASLGPLARTVEDLGLLFAVLTGEAFEAGGGELEKRRSQARARLGGVRVAWYAEDGRAPLTPETRQAVRNAAEALRSAGLSVEESRLPSVERATELWLSLFSRATQEIVAAVYRGRETEAGPTARALLRLAAESKGTQPFDERGAWAERERLRAELLRWMERTPLVVAPVGAVHAFRHEEARRVEVRGQALSIFRAFGHAQAFNVFDLPAACVPAGRTREGLPVGVQVVGRPCEEELVLAAARVVEEALGGWQPPPEA